MNSTILNLDSAYVVDTHALIWYLTGDPKLSVQVKAIFEAAERGETQLILSVISLAEMYYANQKRRLFSDFQVMFESLKSNLAYQFVDLKPDHILEFTRDAAVPEMHDRIIVGLAKRLGIRLITVDSLIIAAQTVTTVW